MPTIEEVASTPQQLSEQYAVNIYGALGFGWLQDSKKAAELGKSILHTAMNAALKLSKE